MWRERREIEAKGEESYDRDNDGFTAKVRIKYLNLWTFYLGKGMKMNN